MEKGKARRDITTSFHQLDLNLNSTKKSSKILPPSHQYPLLNIKKPKPPSLVSLCIGVVGRHFEDIIEDLPNIAPTFPSNIKMVLAAIARRRKLLNDDVIIALAESSWEILDISGSDVSDFGLSQVLKICMSLRAVDISQCSKLTSTGVSELLENCQSLEILRWGGCPASEQTARRCLSILKPTLHDVAGESWEELEQTDIGAAAAQSLRWLVWPKIDKDSLESLSKECPRIIINPKPSPFGYRGFEIPREAFPSAALDDPVVEDIDPKTWAVTGFTARSIISSTSGSDELPMAEKFRLAFLERDNRLAPKRAKNARQHQRRAEKEWVMMDSKAKAMALASRASKSLQH
ncbi:hypothetical protein ACH5RR_037963 [Cinchona calisaya]|uniref:RNI-like superfamily protein n=1 Tax=Cinchona calisaya TaxID=153742 RepID=A0ABD2YBE5_9GENT